MTMPKVGDHVRTPRFCTVTIKEVFESEDAAEDAGFTESAHIFDEPFGINGRSIDLYHMEFAAYRK